MSMAENEPLGMSSPDAETSNWRARAACRDTDPDLFHPRATVIGRGKTMAIHPEILAAKALCDTCTVRAACEEYGRSATTQQAGFRIYGGKLFGVRSAHEHKELIESDIELV